MSHSFQRGRISGKRAWHAGRFESPDKTSSRMATTPPTPGSPLLSNRRLLSHPRARLFKSFVMAGGVPGPFRGRFFRHMWTEMLEVPGIPATDRYGGFETTIRVVLLVVRLIESLLNKVFVQLEKFWAV